MKRLSNNDPTRTDYGGWVVLERDLLSGVRGGAGETCEPDKGGATENICVPAPQLGGACLVGPNISTPTGETWTGGTYP